MARQRVEWVKYCECCGAVHKKEPHKKDCVYFKIIPKTLDMIHFIVYLCINIKTNRNHGNISNQVHRQHLQRH